MYLISIVSNAAQFFNVNARDQSLSHISLYFVKEYSPIKSDCKAFNPSIVNFLVFIKHSFPISIDCKELKFEGIKVGEPTKDPSPR